MIGILILLAGISYLAVWTYRNAFKRFENFPPGPPSLPVYGAYWIILASELNNLAGAFRKLGQWYKTKLVGMFLGSLPLVIVNDPVMIKEMLYKEEFDGRLDIILSRARSYWKKLGIFFTDGYFWHVQRRFSLRYLRDYGFGRRDDTLETVVENEIKEMIDMSLSGPKYPAETKIVKGDLIYLPYFFAVPFINGMMQVFSRSPLRRPQYTALWDLVKGGLRFQRSTNDLGAALSLTPWLKDVMPKFSGYIDLTEGNQSFIDFFTKLIQDVIASKHEGDSRHFLDLYINKMRNEFKEHGKSTFSVDQLVLTCTDYMFPASTAVQMVLTLLVERMLLLAGIQEKVHEEIDRVVGRDRPPTLDDRKDMPYTEACIREMMRLETLVPLGVPHRATQNTTFHGYNIPEGTAVSANYVMLHMDKKIWGDPEAFRPERFITNGQLDVSKDKSLPFGAGRRLCAGETFARQTMFQVFAGFMQAFQVSTVDGTPLRRPARRIQGIITTIPEFWVKVTPRTERTKLN